jgi:hypothetical protein
MSKNSNKKSIFGKHIVKNIPFYFSYFHEILQKQNGGYNYSYTYLHD